MLLNVKFQQHGALYDVANCRANTNDDVYEPLASVNRSELGYIVFITIDNATDTKEMTNSILVDFLKRIFFFFFWIFVDDLFDINFF